MHRRGASLIEILIGIIIVTTASAGALVYYGHGMGRISRQGNRRAALERARERLDQLVAVSAATIKPPDNDNALYWVSCAGGACTRTAAYVAETVSVDNLPAQRIESTVQWINDLSAGTPTSTSDTLALDVQVWFIRGSSARDDFNRVHIRTLRTPP